MIDCIDNVSFSTSSVSSFTKKEGSNETELTRAEQGKANSFITRQRNYADTLSLKERYDALVRAEEVTEIPPIAESSVETTVLVLYYKPGCPYCDKVLKEARRLGITLQLKNTQNPMYKEELLKWGKKGQVPCLMVHESGGTKPAKVIYESNDIINYLRRNQPKSTEVSNTESCN